MNLWIKTLASILFFFPLVSFSCELNSPHIISLSGPVSTYLNELGIINQVEGISSYHPVPSFKKTRYAGGIYLSNSTLKSFEGKVVFFDRSREFKKVLNRFPKVKGIEIDSRRKTPQEVIQLTGLVLQDYLKGCELQVKELEKKVSELENYIKKNAPKLGKSIFFLGKISEKLPETVMANDGFIYWLRKEKLVESYPSDLEYLNWSMKIISPLRGQYLFFGLQDSFSDGEKKIEKLGPTIYNVKYPGALTPGYTQLEFIKYLIDYFLG